MHNMTDAEQKKFVKILHKQIAELESYDQATKDSRATVTLDQTTVGRLSRMDAIQQQAMANTTSQRRKAEVIQAKTALDRIDQGEFGYCVECGEDIAIKRLNYNPSVATCIICASG